jgi:hypothetical protein
MARVGIFALVILVIGFFAYIDINAYKLGFAPPSQRINEHPQVSSVVSPHHAYRHAQPGISQANIYFSPYNNTEGMSHNSYGSPQLYYGYPSNGIQARCSSFKPEFGQPREGY